MAIDGHHQFQFQNGTIKRGPKYEMPLFFQEFQFQNGTIKRMDSNQKKKE